MEVGPHAKKNKMKKEKKERRPREKDAGGEVTEELRKARRTANEKLMEELRLITAAAARMQRGRSDWSGDGGWDAEDREPGGSWQGGGGSSSSGGRWGGWQGNRRWGGHR